jgi:hypothetical protein
LQEQLIKLDAEQVQALQLEDFERAEKLNEKIEGTRTRTRTRTRTCTRSHPYLTARPTLWLMLMILFFGTSNTIEVKEEMKKIARQKLQFSQQVLVLHVKRGHAAQKEAQLRRSFIDQLKELKVPPPPISHSLAGFQH